MNRKSKVVVCSLSALTLIACGLLFVSCGQNNYDNYKGYQKGYEAAHKGSSEPSFLSSDAEKKGYAEGLSELRSGNKPPEVAFAYTKQEIKSLENRWDTFEGMVSDAFKGDREAMFSVGLCYLYGGKGLPVDVSKANMFFAKAASLGHAPSLEKIRIMYHEQLDEDMSKGLMHQVYMNLIIAMGHTEYSQKYLDTRTGLIKKTGERGKLLAEEIERIAEEKVKAIYENLDELEKKKHSKDCEGFFLELNDITMIDQIYDLKHWLSVAGVE